MRDGVLFQKCEAVGAKVLPRKGLQSQQFLRSAFVCFICSNNGGFAILCGRQIAAPTARIFVKGEIVSEGGELTSKRKTSLRSGLEARAPTAASQRANTVRPYINGASQSFAGGLPSAPTLRVLVKGEIVSEGGEKTATTKRKKTLRGGADAPRSSNSGFAFWKLAGRAGSRPKRLVFSIEGLFKGNLELFEELKSWGG